MVTHMTKGSPDVIDLSDLTKRLRCTGLSGKYPFHGDLNWNIELSIGQCFSSDLISLLEVGMGRGHGEDLCGFGRTGGRWMGWDLSSLRNEREEILRRRYE